MSSPATPVLPPSLSAKLSALAKQPARSEARHALDEILAELANLPAHSIVRASREIAASAYLGWWQPEKRPIQIVPTPSAPSLRVQLLELERVLSDKALLAANPISPSLRVQLLKYRLGLERVPSDKELLAANPNFAWLFLFHPNGYIREAALDSIVKPPTSAFFFAALAWRLNDWAGPVRKAAERCAMRVMNRTDAGVAANAALYLLDRRHAWARWGDERQALDGVFERKDVIAVLATLLQEHPTGPLATSLRHALRYPNIDEELPRIALSAIQPSVRAVAYQCLISGKAAWPVGFEWIWVDKVYGRRRRVPRLATRDLRRTRPAAEFVREAAYDKSPFVRRVAADALIAARAQLPDEEVLIAHLAKDRSSAVRSRADFMRRHPPSRQPL
jgi:hypothetical protein